VLFERGSGADAPIFETDSVRAVGARLADRISARKDVTVADEVCAITATNDEPGYCAHDLAAGFQPQEERGE
jgi:hypothetical protein